VAAWLFDDNLNDCSGNGNDGTTEGGQFIDGPFGKALYLDADSYFEVPNPDGAVFGLTDSLTVMLWAYITDLPSTWGGMPRIMDSGDSAGWVMHPTAEGEGYAMYFWGYIEGWQGVSDPQSFPYSEEWHHWAVTYDGAKLILYRDGEVVSEKDVSGSITPGDGALRFSHEFAGRITVGAFDECLISGDALSPADISNAMMLGLGDSGLVPSCGTTAVDQLGKLAVTWGALKR
jgi:hypothetical protein